MAFTALNLKLPLLRVDLLSSWSGDVPFLKRSLAQMYPEGGGG